MTTTEPQNDGSGMARWIRTSVEVFEHDIFAGDTFSRRDAWLWLIANAAWKPRRFRLSGSNKFVELQRGQVLAARGYLAEVWGWGEKQVRNFVHLLEKENMIKMDQSKGRFANVVTICNYEKYQTANSEKGQLDGRLRASSGPVEGQTLTSITNSTNKPSSTVLVEAAREAPSVATPPDGFVDQLIKAAAPCLADPVNSMGLITEATPMMWLQTGCDVDRDILPTLRAAAKKYAGKRISTWGYFTPMIAETRQRRLAGLPAVVLKPTASAQPVLTFTPKKRAMSDAEIEAAKERIALEEFENQNREYAQ